MAATTITGDFMCRATNVDYRMDTPSAPAFLGQYVSLPSRWTLRGERLGQGRGNCPPEPARVGCCHCGGGRWPVAWFCLTGCLPLLTG